MWDYSGFFFFYLFLCYMPQRIPQSSILFLLALWLTTVGTVLSLCQTFLLGPASQLVADVTRTITNFCNYDSEGVDRNSPFDVWCQWGGFHLNKMYRGGIFGVTVKCAIGLVIIDKWNNNWWFTEQDNSKDSLTALNCREEHYSLSWLD